ncbi:MAG: hypothetical protein A4E32_01518 [Methanomassiliicoccales archaeon PtaU1.Bin124]|nr:MAG: hypothetical protein A4E32_01518 [Methanomassiliicoccales archaeon PtaU1.Bin124]
MRKVGTFSLVLMTLAILLVLIPAAIAGLTLAEPWQSYPGILAITTIATALSLPTRLIWPSTDVPYYAIGLAMAINVVLYAMQNGSPWGVWSMGMSYLIAGFLLQKTDWTFRPKKEPGFEAEDERWIMLSAIRSAVGGAARFAAIFIVSIALLLVLPWLALPSVELWTIAVLAIVVLFTLTWLSAAEA